MKKTALLLFILTVSLLQLQGCHKDPQGPGFDLEAMKKQEILESIMNGERKWKIGSMISDIPREYEYMYENLDADDMLDTIRSVSTDWLSQLPTCENDDPIILHYMKSTDMYGIENPDDIYIRVDGAVGEKCSIYEHPTVFHGQGKSVVKFEQYQIKLSGTHSRFYGYNIFRLDPADEDELKELWTNFKATPDRISFEVDKTYKGQVYHLEVTLVPL